MSYKAILGTKIGMTQIFSQEGVLIPVTAIQIEPNYVVEVKTQATHGYDAVVVGYGQIRRNLVSKPVQGQFKKSGLAPTRHLIELRNIVGYQVGDQVQLSQQFQVGDCVDVQGTSRGHGFTGAIKLWNFATGPRSHGAGWPHRYQGSLETGRGGSAAQRVWKGKKMAGRYGHETVSVINLKIVAIDEANNLLLVKGSIPGRNKSLVRVKTTISHVKKVSNPFNLFVRNQPEMSTEDKEKSQETTV